MRLEIDIPEHHYNNIMAIDSINLGRAPYKGIIMYAINAIKHGKVLEQEPSNSENPNNSTTKNDLGVDAVSRKAVINQIFYSTDNNGDVVLGSALRERIARLPSVTPQEPKTGHWKDIPKYTNIVWECSECGHFTTLKHNYCSMCGAKMVEPQESEDKE